MPRNVIAGVVTLYFACGLAKSANTVYEYQQQQPQQHSRTQPANTFDHDEYIPLVNSGLRDNFEWQLLKELSSSNKGNTIISPISLKVLLALLYEGAGGSTQTDLKNVLEFANKTEVRQIYSNILASLTEGRPQSCEAQDAEGAAIKTAKNAPSRRPNEESFTLSIGTRIFLDSRVKAQQAFESKACEKYQTRIIPTDFADGARTSNMINDYVKRATNGKITHIVDASDITNSVMLMVNALYFRGYWSFQFPKESSHRGGFYLAPGHAVQVDYMATTNSYFYVESAILDAKIIRIPYKGKKFAMIVVLPNAKAGLDTLLEQLNVANLRQAVYTMDRRTVDLVLPKFAFDYQSRMSDTLKRMGLGSLFDNAASLAGIVRDNKFKLQVSDVLQKAGIEVNEEGSTASAASAIAISNKFGDAQALFNATHPFLFYIEDQVGQTILFLGKVVNPLEQVALPLPPRFSADAQADAVVAPTKAHPEQALVHYRPAQQNFGETAPAAIPTPPSPSSSSTSALGLGSGPPSTVIESPEDQSVAKRFNYFDLELLEALAMKSSAYENIFVSPASIKSTLGMILEGAAGRSATEIANVLRIPLQQQYVREQLKQLLYDISGQMDYTALFSANGIFVSDKLRVVGAYQRAVQDFYKAQIRQLNYDNVGESAATINQWVATVSKGLIPSIVGSENINQDSSVLLANAMYFKSVWKYAFDPAFTAVRCFNLPNGQCANAHMMHNTAELRYKMLGEINAHALEIPYNDDYAMLVLVPAVRHSITSLLRDLQHVTFNAIVDKLEKTEVTYEIPKFDIDYNVPLRSVLQKLEIREIFGDNANLSGIVHNQRVRVSDIVHKAKIEVNEQGTIAAAATSAVVIPLMGSTTPHIIANHPFAFFIYKMSNRNIIFEGIVNHPTEAAPTPATQVHSAASPLPVGRKIDDQNPTLLQSRASYQPVVPLSRGNFNLQRQRTYY